MCSTGVFFGVWLFSFMNVTSICSGVFDNTRIRSVSVVTFRGMRLSITMRSGRMSCAWARDESITNMFSLFSASMAGSPSGILNGILSPFFCLYGYSLCSKILQKYKKIRKQGLPCAEKACGAVHIENQRIAKRSSFRL